MPLIESSSHTAWQKNTAELIKTGRKPNQAAAIAWKTKREAKAKGK